MENLIVIELEKIKSPLLKAFAFRFYNVFKSFVLPIVVGTVLKELTEHGNFEGIMEARVWGEMLFLIVFTLVGSANAGLDKVSRTESK